MYYHEISQRKLSSCNGNEICSVLTNKSQDTLLGHIQ